MDVMVPNLRVVRLGGFCAPMLVYIAARRNAERSGKPT